MDKTRGNKWLILICFIVGLSFGVHFMALLTIPAIVLIYYFKNIDDFKYENLNNSLNPYLTLLIVSFVFFLFSSKTHITLLFSIPAAYAIARLNFFGKTFLSTSILIIYMFPAIVLVIPLYTVFSQLGLRNSIEGLLIVYTATTLPVAIYMLQGYFKSIPKEIEEAGLIDGQNWFGIIIKIIIPLSLPAIASVSLYVFMIAWNEFLFSLMFLDNPKTFTLSRAINHLTGDAETPRQYLMAGSVIVTLPILLIFVYFEKYLVSGLTAGSVKG